MSRQSIATIRLIKGRDFQSLRGHPWIFSGSLATKEVYELGSIIRVENCDKQLVGYGFYEGQSIAVKLIVGAYNYPDTDFWRELFKQAVLFRKTLGYPEPEVNTAYRLIHGEADGVPGLIIDIYNEIAVVEFHSAGAKLLAATWQEIIPQVLPMIKQIIFRNQIEEGLVEPPLPVVIFENRRKIQVSFAGQKTGYFLDQASNRELVKKYSVQRKVLDCFCYSGGFTVAAIAGGCSSVLSIDSSSSALEQVTTNVELNFPESKTLFSAFKADCLNWLHKSNEQFDLIILDPPAFVKNRAALKGGIAGYKSINRQAFKMLNLGGFLFTFSCSQLVSDQEFENIVREAAIESKRSVRIVERMGQAPSHAHSLFHSEGHYLKGLLLHVR